MIYRLWLAVAFFVISSALSACQTELETFPTPTDAPTVEATAEVTEVAVMSPEWIEEQAGDVEIGMWKPVGWTLDSSTGVTLLQHNPSLDSHIGSPENGIIINIFSPNLEHMDLPEAPEDANHALQVLDYVVSTPGIISSSSVASDPQPFTWNGHDAAFYLLTGQHYKRAIVICVAIEPDLIVGINIAMPHNMAEDARQLIPQLFNDFTAAGVQLGADDLAMLPDPLIFPHRDAEQTPEHYGG